MRVFSKSQPHLETDSTLQRDLIPVNAVLGFLKRDPHWPSILYESGYRLTMIEQPVSVPSVGTVEADIICLNRKGNHAIVWECKSGRTVEEKQARVYAALSPTDVQRTGNVTFPHPSSASAEVVYCCLSEDSKTVSTALRELGLAIPVVSLGAKAELASGQIKDTTLCKQLMAGVALPSLEEVPRFLLANTQTGKPDLARLVFPTLVSLLRRQVGRISPRQILEETFNEWACMGTDLRRHLSDLVKEILFDVCKNELQEFAQIVKASHSPKEFFIEFTAGLLGRDASARTKTFQKFERLAYGFVERLESNRPFEPAREPETGWLFPPESIS